MVDILLPHISISKHIQTDRDLVDVLIEQERPYDLTEAGTESLMEAETTIFLVLVLFEMMFGFKNHEPYLCKLDSVQ